MRIAIDLNGVLRNTLDKIEQVYEKFYLSNDEDEILLKIPCNYGDLSDEEDIFNFNENMRVLLQSTTLKISSTNVWFLN
jgi:hypothetical protein